MDLGCRLSTDDIDVVAISEIDKCVVVGECKFKSAPQSLTDSVTG